VASNIFHAFFFCNAPSSIMFVRNKAMWVRRAAIRPIPLYARVTSTTLDQVEALLSDEGASGEEALTQAFRRFETSQPALAARIALTLRRPLDETALALGYFLSLAVWLAFEQTFGAQLGEIVEQDVETTHQAILFDEELRRNDPKETVDTDDVVAMEQPELLGFIREHIDVVLETPEEVAIEDVDLIYRMLLLEVVALSHAVVPPTSLPLSKAAWVA